MTCPECEGEGRLCCGYCSGLGTRTPDQAVSYVCYFCGGCGHVKCDNCWGERVIASDEDDTQQNGHA